jgi:hypothetical protein
MLSILHGTQHVGGIHLSVGAVYFLAMSMEKKTHEKIKRFLKKKI